MKLKYVGNKTQKETHRVILVSGKYKKVKLNEVFEVEDQEGYRIQATGEFAIVDEKERKTRPTTNAKTKDEEYIVIEKVEE